MTQAEVSFPQTNGRAAVTAWLTTERVAYGAAALMAVTARLWALGAQPLGPAEAAQALPAWQAARGLEYSLAGASPLLFTLQRFLFAPLGGSDALARWWPAVLGGLSPLLFYALRNRLGRGGALMAAYLWALSPMAIFASRLGLGFGLVPPLALAFVAALNLAVGRRGPAQWPLVWAAIALGALLAAGSGTYTVILALLVLALIWPRGRAAILAPDRRVAANRRTIVMAALLSLVLGSTAFLTAPGGLAATADLLGNWVRGLLPGPGTYSFFGIPGRLVLSDPLIVALGLGGLGMAIGLRMRAQRASDDETASVESTASHGDPAFLLSAAVAAGIALLVSSAGEGRHPADLALVILPWTMLAGPALAWIVEAVWGWRKEVDPWLLVGLSLALLTGAAISLPSYLSATDNASRSLYLAVGLGTLILTVALWLVYGFFASWRTVGLALPVVGLVIGGIWGLSQLSGINYEVDPLRRAAVLVEAPGPGWSDFRAELGALSALNGGGTEGAPVDVVLPAGQDADLASMLQWELRNHSALHMVTSLPANPAGLVITPSDLQPALGDRYSGASFNLLESWRPASLPDITSRVRWVLYREAKTAPDRTWAIVLWVDRGASQMAAPAAPPADQSAPPVQPQQ